ncbi:hypothetical protein J7K41_03445 [Candidatus Micrarchaeota archaeon]|nr:hypothetical protein [Candidatus Micrarchaeota archaeon]
MNWLVITVITIMGMSGLTTVLYMIARSFNLKELERWTKSEYVELFVTAFIVVFMLAIGLAFMVLGRVVSYALFNPGVVPSSSSFLVNQPTSYDPQVSAIVAMENIADALRTDYSVVALFAIVLGALGNVEVDISGWGVNLYTALVVGGGSAVLPVVGVGALFLAGAGLLKKVGVGGIAERLPFAGSFNWYMLPIVTLASPLIVYILLSAIPQTFKYGAELIANLLFLQYFLIELVKFSGYIATFMLPTGIAMRAFPGTRGMGAMFISISLGFLFVFPLSYLMLMYVSGITPSQVQESSLETVPGYEELREVADVTCLDVSTIGTYKDVVFYLYQQGKIDSLLDALSGRLEEYFLVVFAYPAAALTITYTFIRSFGMMLGAELGEIGKGLIKLL